MTVTHVADPQPLLLSAQSTPTSVAVAGFADSVDEPLVCFPFKMNITIIALYHIIDIVFIACLINIHIAISHPLMIILFTFHICI